MTSRTIGELAAGAVIAVCLAATASSAAGATSYYVGHGDDHNARVSFKVRNGEVRSAILEIRQMPVKLASGKTVTLHVADALARVPRVRGTDSAFHGVRKRKGQHSDGTSCFRFGGHLWAGRDPSGSTSLEAEDDFASFHTGKIRWEASPVGKKRFKQFRGIVAHLLSGHSRAVAR